MVVKGIESNTLLPVAFVFHPEWWHKNQGLSFEREFFYDPDIRVEADLTMRKILNRKFGEYGVEREEEPRPRPSIGGVHLAAGYIISEMFGCEVEFSADASPQVIPREISDREADNIQPVKLQENDTFLEFKKLVDTLKERFDYVEGDINWQGVLNVALDLRGEQIFIDMMENPERAHRIFAAVTETIKNFVKYVRGETGTTSISVNRTVKFVNPEINLHSNCSVVMISPDNYREFLFDYDCQLAEELQPYGVHHCGNNMDVHADAYSEIPGVSFFDVGWGSDIATCRQKLPEAFLNLRYDPVKMGKVGPKEIEKDVIRMLKEAGAPRKTGFCCINMGHEVPDENVITIIKTVKEFRNKYLKDK